MRALHKRRGVCVIERQGTIHVSDPFHAIIPIDPPYLRRISNGVSPVRIFYAVVEKNNFSQLFDNHDLTSTLRSCVACLLFRIFWFNF